MDWRSLALDASRRTAVKRHAGLQADLGGIAKGYGVDRAVAALETRGVQDFMVEVGGEVRTRGVNATGQAWRIGIEEPDAMPQRARWVVPLSGRAMATSGDYRNYFFEDGQRYSHESTLSRAHRSATVCAPLRSSRTTACVPTRWRQR